MKGTIEDIKRMRRAAAGRGLGSLIRIPEGAKVVSIDDLDTTRPPGIDRGQFEGPTE